MCAEVPPDARGRHRPLRRVGVSKVVLTSPRRFPPPSPVVPVHMEVACTVFIYGYFIDLIAADET